MLVDSGAKWSLYHSDWRALARDAPRRADGTVGDFLCVDAPYSKEVHDGHGTMARHGTSTPPGYDNANRRNIDYEAWDEWEVREFVETWSPLVRGWFGSISDDELGIVWKHALGEAGRLKFPLIPCTERGGTVRLAGDGPSSQTTFLAIARPRNREFLKWGVTESHYIGPREKKLKVGGKTRWFLSALIRDYSLPGNIVIDPCCGGGTAGVMAVANGRMAILGDIDENAVAITRKVMKISEGIIDAPGAKLLTAPGGAQGGLFSDDSLSELAVHD